MLAELFEATTSDVPGDPRFPIYTCAPDDEGAAAPGSPWVHLVTFSERDEIVIRFWSCEPSGPTVAVDFEPLRDDLLWGGGPPVVASAELVAQIIIATFFVHFGQGWDYQQGVREVKFRDIRDGTRLTLPLPERFDESVVPPLLSRIRP